MNNNDKKYLEEIRKRSRLPIATDAVYRDRLWLLARLNEETKAREAVEARIAASFIDAWAKKEAEGYQYGEDALEQVRFGWDMRQEALAKKEGGQ